MKENCLWCLNQKSKNSAWTLKYGEQWKGSTKWSIKLRLKLAQHCIQLTIAKNENFSKTAVTFWPMIVCLLTVTALHKSCEISF